MSIPTQLKKENFRFAKVGYKGKRAIETGWLKENNYKYNDPNLQEHIKDKKNYSVLGGFGDLIIVDSDSQEGEILIKENLPETFTVKTGSEESYKKHFYYYCKDGKNLKLYLNEKNKTLADIQFQGRCVIGSGSIHPSGGEYKVLEDKEIKEIEYSQIIYCFRDYLKFSHKQETKRSNKTSNEIETDDICAEIKEKVNMRVVLELAGVDTSKNPTDCLMHDSNGGKCFSFTDKIFNCFHCNWSGSIFDFYMKYKKCDFNEAKKRLGEIAGVKEDERYLFSFFSATTNFIEQANIFIKKQPIWYTEGKLWWLWNHKSKCWVLKDEVDLLNAIDYYTKMPTSHSAVKGNWLEALKRVGRLNAPKPMKKSWIQFKDVIIDYKTLKFKQSIPTHFITNTIPWKMGDSDETPMMDKLFEEWVGKDYVKTLYQIIAYCTICDYPIHRLFCLIGEGLNGKTSFLKLLKKFIGTKNITSTELDVLLNSRFEITRLHKKLVCVMGETNFNEMKQTSQLKKLTGGDLIGFEYKNKDPFEDENYAKIIMATNNLPATTDKTIGFYRRWLIIDFPNRFDETNDVLSDIPEKEYNNLANKCVNIIAELMRNREFHNEGTIEERMKKYEDKSNPFDKFMSENVNEDCEGHIFKWDFKKKLEDWCKDNKFRLLSETKIGMIMKKRGIFAEKIASEWYEKGKQGETKYIRAWVGIKWMEMEKEE